MRKGKRQAEEKRHPDTTSQRHHQGSVHERLTISQTQRRPWSF
jgi:hypothetical protein